MTDVIVAPRVEDITSDTEAVMSGAHFRIRPSQTYVSGGQWVLAEWPAAMTALAGSPVTVKLDANASVPYEIEIYKGGRTPIIHEYRIVPSSGSPVSWQDLAQVAGAGSTPALPSALEARVIALQSQIGSVSGGASNLASITDMSAFMRTVNDDTTASAARTTLGAAATSHAHGIADITATGTPSTTTFLRGDGTWSGTPAAGNPDWADITGKPSTFTPATHSHVAADVTDSTTIGRTVLTAADAAAIRTALGVLAATDVIDIEQAAPGSIVATDGSSTPRPTARTDITVLWTASSAPTNAIAGDLWANGPDS
jgi:hypothetical protein